MIKPSVRDLKLKLSELLEDHLGKIIDIEGEEFPGIQDGLQIDGSLQYIGVVALIKSVENGEKRSELQGFRNRGNIEVHFVLFSGFETSLKEIWDIVDDNFKDVSKIFIDQNVQYGQTGKLVVYFQFDYRA